MKISSPILEARWIEGIEGKRPRWYCGLRSCSFWLAEYWDYVETPWYGRDVLIDKTFHGSFGLLLLPDGFTKRNFEGRAVYVHTKRSGHKLEVNRAQRVSLEVFEHEGRIRIDEGDDVARVEKAMESFHKARDGYREITGKLKAEKGSAGRLPLPTPALVQCPHCKRLSAIRKKYDGQTEIEAKREATLEEFDLRN